MALLCLQNDVQILKWNGSMCGMHKRIGNFQRDLSSPGTPFPTSSKSDGFFFSQRVLSGSIWNGPFCVCGPNSQISAVFVVQPKHTASKRSVLRALWNSQILDCGNVCLGSGFFWVTFSKAKPMFSVQSFRPQANPHCKIPLKISLSPCGQWNLATHSLQWFPLRGGVCPPPCGFGAELVTCFEQQRVEEVVSFSSSV